MTEMREKTGLISCIIPVYNRQDLIAECLQSVLSQTVDNYEIIIVDDGSTDNTPDTIDDLKHSYPEKIRIFTQINQGPGAARQFGLDHALGEYIQFLDSDDLLQPEKFEKSIGSFNQEPYPDVVYSITHYYQRNNPEEFIIWKQDQQGKTAILPDFFNNRVWSTSTPIYKKALLDKAGTILPLSCEEDLEFDCRIGLQNPKIGFINEHLTDFRDHSGLRFSKNNPNRAIQLCDQIQSRAHIYQTMLEFGLNKNSDEMKEFAKFMFLLARQAGELNLIKESKSAIDLAQKAGAELDSKNKLAMYIYKIVNHLAGRKRGSRLFNAVYNRFHNLKNLN